MRQLFLRFAVAPSLLALSCATAIEEGGFGAPLDSEGAGKSNDGGSLVTSGTGGGNSASGSTSMSSGGKAGSSSGAFGGSSTMGGSASAEGGQAGSASGGKGGMGGSPSGGSSGGKGGSGTSGTSNAGSAGTGGSGSAGGPGSTVCDGVPNWTATTYEIGDTVASTCSGVFAGTCPPGQSHKFECNPMAGVPALPWCTSRAPGIGNGWAEAWVDKGQCQ